MSDKPLSRLTYSIPEVAELLDIGRNAAYDAAKSGDIPTIRIGKTIRAPKALIDRMLGLGGEAA
jgi:excisionase family DNA binding protein